MNSYDLSELQVKRIRYYFLDYPKGLLKVNFYKEMIKWIYGIQSSKPRMSE